MAFDHVVSSVLLSPEETIVPASLSVITHSARGELVLCA